MHRIRLSEPVRAARGFTLIESILVIAVVGILFAIVAVFIVPPVRAYFATQARAALVDQADLALRRIARDLRIALPNSTRVSASGRALELIPTAGAARYRTEGADRLEFGALDTTFDLIGTPLALAASQQLVFYNLGPGIVGSDAYAANGSAAEQAVSNRRTSTTAPGTVNSVTMSSLAGLPVAGFAAPHRVFAVDSPITYRCDLATRTLTRHQGYGFLAAQPDPPAGGNSAVLASGVTGCAFKAESWVVAARAGLVSLALTLTTTTPSGDESVALHHAVHVDNLP